MIATTPLNIFQRSPEERYWYEMLSGFIYLKIESARVGISGDEVPWVP